MKYSVLAGLLILLTACQSPEERAQEQAQKQIAACTKAGYEPNTPAFDDCKLEVKIQQEQKTQDRINSLQDVHPISSNYQQITPQSGNSIPFP